MDTDRGSAEDVERALKHPRRPGRQYSEVTTGGRSSGRIGGRSSEGCPTCSAITALLLFWLDAAIFWAMRKRPLLLILKLPPFIPPLKRGKRSAFDRHYGTRTSKRRRNVCLVLLWLSLLMLAVVAVDPVFSHKPLQIGYLFSVGLLCAVFLALTISFHLRYRSRE